MARSAHADTAARGRPFPRSGPGVVRVVLALVAVLVGVLTPTASGHDGRPALAATSGIAPAGVAADTAQPGRATDLEAPAGAEASSRSGTATGPRVAAIDVEGEKAAPHAVHDVDDATRDARRGRAPPGVSRDFPGEPHHAHLVAAVFTSYARVSPPVACGWQRSSSFDPAGPSSYPSRPPGRAPPSPPGI